MTDQPLLPESPCNARSIDQPVLPESRYFIVVALPYVIAGMVITKLAMIAAR